MNLTEKQIEEIAQKARDDGRNDILKNGTPSHNQVDNPIDMNVKGEDIFRPYIASVLKSYKVTGNTDPKNVAKAAKELSESRVSRKYKDGSFNAINKALTENSPTDGGYLDFPEYSTQYIDIVYPPTSMRKLPGIETWTMSQKNLIVPRGTVGGSSSWGDEVFTSAIPSSGNKFGQLELKPKTLRSYIQISQDMIDDESLNIVDIISKNLILESAIAENTAFWNGTGGNYQPLGIVGQLVQNIVGYTGTATQAVTPSYSGSTTFSGAVNNFLAGSAAQVWPEQDLKNALIQVRTGTNELGYKNYIMDPITWVMNTYTKETLATLRFPTYGYLVFPSISENNTLWGYPIMISSDSDNPNFRIYCVAAPNIIIGDRLGVQLYVDPIQNIIPQAHDQHVLILKKRTDIIMKYSTAMSYVAYTGQ